MTQHKSSITQLTAFIDGISLGMVIWTHTIAMNDSKENKNLTETNLFLPMLLTLNNLSIKVWKASSYKVRKNY